MVDAIVRILAGCHVGDATMPPTELYNEGWMLRLVLDWLARNPNVEHVLSFAPGARWYSEALLASRFLPSARNDTRAEGYTHADGVVGHFTIKPGERGEAVPKPDARQFMVLEAKMGSPLSAGTKNAPAYDQAARNVACIAHVIGAAGLHPKSLDRLAFYVIAPAAQINARVFGSLMTKASIETKVRQRIAAYEGQCDAWLDKVFLPTLDHIDLRLLSWEEILAPLEKTAETESLQLFYERCLLFNPPRRPVNQV